MIKRGLSALIMFACLRISAWWKPLICVCLFFVCGSASGQSVQKFRGAVTYHYTEFPSGNFPIKLEKVIFHENYFYQQVLQASYGLHFNDLYCDLQKSKRYEVNESSKALIDLGAEPEGRVELQELQHLKDTVIHGELCSTITFWRKQARSGQEERVDYTYYLSKSKEIQNIGTIALLQGNYNTKILDGQFKMLPIRITMVFEKGKVLTIEAVRIEPDDFDPAEKFKNYKR